MTPKQIAKLITEDPDVILEWEVALNLGYDSKTAERVKRFAHAIGQQLNESEEQLYQRFLRGDEGARQVLADHLLEQGRLTPEEARGFTEDDLVEFLGGSVSTRLENTLGKLSIREVLNMDPSEVLDIRNVGMTTLQELQARLAAKGFRLRPWIGQPIRLYFLDAREKYLADRQLQTMGDLLKLPPDDGAWEILGGYLYGSTLARYFRALSMGWEDEVREVAHPETFQAFRL